MLFRARIKSLGRVVMRQGVRHPGPSLLSSALAYGTPLHRHGELGTGRRHHWNWHSRAGPAGGISGDRILGWIKQRMHYFVLLFLLLLISYVCDVIKSCPFWRNDQVLRSSENSERKRFLSSCSVVSSVRWPFSKRLRHWSPLPIHHISRGWNRWGVSMAYWNKKTLTLTLGSWKLTRY